MKAIINANIIMTDHVIPNGVILFEDGVIKDFGKAKDVAVPNGAQIIDAENNYVGPGLIDIHTHAAAKTYFTEDPKKCSEELLRHGVTSVLPALYYSLDKTAFVAAIEKIINAYESGNFSNFIGFYMEGPYLNPGFGCNQDKNMWRFGVEKSDYQELIDKSKDYTKVWCIAPEREGIENFVKDVKKAIPNCLFAVAHSAATPEQVEKFIPYGLKIATHHTNATGTIEHYSECRGVCVDEAVNYNKEIYAELICDRIGAHVVPYMQRLVRRVKGDDRIILISDQFVDDGPVPAGFEEATDINFDHSGEIAGSAMTLDLACKNVLFHMGCSVCDAFRFASTNPARVLGLWDRGSIAKGNIADLVIVNQFFDIKKVIFKGENL
jgi:N-acetylglucosamine-6-phosphate deacetylase